MATRVYDRAYNEFYLNNAMNTLATMLHLATNRINPASLLDATHDALP